MRAFFIAALLLFSSSAFSQDYYWYLTGNSSIHFPSAVSACISTDGLRDGSTRHHNYVSTQIHSSGTSAVCKSEIVFDSDGRLYGSNRTSGGANRVGTSCPVDYEYNIATGGCDAPAEIENLCEIKIGISSPFSLTGTAPDSFVTAVSGSFLATEQTGCFSGCTAQTLDSSCRTNSDGTYTCKGTADFTGAECTSSPSDPEALADETVTSEPLPPPITEIVDRPCNYITSSDGTKNCQSEKIVKKEGQLCGTFNGQAICQTKQPTENGVKISTDIVETSNADGTTTQKKTDVATKTSCVGLACTVTTTSSVSITNKDATGTTTATTSTCEGSGCTGNSSDGGPLSGGGECITDCEEGGDDLDLPGLDDVDTFGEATTKFMGRVADAPMLAAVGNIGLSGSGSCFFPSASTLYFDVNLNIICENSDWLNPLYFVMLAFWGFAAVRVFLSA